MRLIEALFIAVVGLVSVGLDIAGFFVVARLITLHRRIPFLLAFDRVGQPLVDPLVTAVQRAIPTEWMGEEPRRTRLATAATLLAVAMCRFALNGASHVLIIPL